MRLPHMSDNALPHCPTLRELVVTELEMMLAQMQVPNPSLAFMHVHSCTLHQYVMEAVETQGVLRAPNSDKNSAEVF